MDRSAKIGVKTGAAIAYHGWGYERSCWDEWAARLATAGIPLAAADRGYFGPAHAPGFSDHEYRILLAHSYGLHLCPVEQLRQTDLLVILSSFAEFHPPDPRQRRRSQRVLGQMIQACQHDPQTVLQQFRLQCGESAERIAQVPAIRNHELLNHDLQALHHCRINMSHLQQIPTVMIFHGVADQIVPVSQGRDLADQLGAHEHWYEIQDADHCLAFSHGDACWERLKLHLDAIAV